MLLQMLAGAATATAAAVLLVCRAVRARAR